MQSIQQVCLQEIGKGFDFEKSCFGDGFKNHACMLPIETPDHCCFYGKPWAYAQFSCRCAFYQLYLLTV